MLKELLRRSWLVPTTAGLALVAIASPASAAEQSWRTVGVAGVAADGIARPYDASCFIEGWVDDTRADGHAAGVQYYAEYEGPTTGRTYTATNHNGQNGDLQWFRHDFNRGVVDYVEIREIISEQGRVLRTGSWQRVCD